MVGPRHREGGVPAAGTVLGDHPLLPLWTDAKAAQALTIGHLDFWQIKEAYRAMAKKYHPDLCDEAVRAEAEVQFKLINEARMQLLSSHGAPWALVRKLLLLFLWIIKSL